MTPVYYVAWVVLGISCDWATYSRCVSLLGRPGPADRDDGYTRLLFPRIIVTSIGILTMTVAGMGSEVNTTLSLLGAALWFLSVGYGVYQYLMGR